jgi:hypothetical protein
MLEYDGAPDILLEMNTLNESVLQAIGTFALGVISTILGRELAEAKLEIAKTSTNFLLPSCVIDVQNVLRMAPALKGNEARNERSFRMYRSVAQRLLSTNGKLNSKKP